ncbi:serine/threonine-protein kinase MARK2-like [Rousettus aegyptiacus]|uniref:serine/threonine-protein kinase MARK2-like n=1 Tax=Rousettus aegyptiacus TaxID=9407 RepID=UPI00168CE518|nr:serine/threonine-protein kinase MARK2-like [Rousettus aegyptiacus]
MPHDLAAISPVREPRIGHYQLLQTIGEGTYGVVKLARHIITGVEVAVKVIDRRGAYRPRREVKTMKRLNHPNIVKLYQVIDTEYTIFLFMEHASRGNLFRYLRRFGRMNEHEAQRMFRQLISAVHYCHQKDIIHRDLKAENVLLDAELNVKLADFGLSSTYVGRKMYTVRGSLPYLAPEVFLSECYDGPGADVWSLGVILYEIVTGKWPFMAVDETGLWRKIMRGEFQLPYFVSFLCKNVVKKILVLTPESEQLSNS